MDYRGKRVALAAYGVENKAAGKYLKVQGAEVVIYDDNPDLEGSLGSIAEISDVDIIVRSPPIHPDRLPKDFRTTSATNIFFEQCPAPIIGVTGTKGKGTTSTLIAKMLEPSKAVHLVGNIGQPALEVLPSIQPDDIVIYELSSFQLWDLKISPKVAVILAISEDHQDVHVSMDEYVKAKSMISAHQEPSDLCILHPHNQLSESAAVGDGRKVRFLSPEAANIEDDNYVINSQIICATKEAGLIGPHNQENIAAAITAAWQYVQDPQQLAKAIKSFKGLEHRLEFVRKVNEVSYYNDSQATTAAATLAAINSFEQPKILILGGSDKGLDFTELARKLAESPQKKILLIGEMSQKFTQLFKELGVSNFENVQGGMKEIVQTAHRHADPNDVVLLSPACASFDMFDSYQDRGNQFKEAVKQLSDL